VARLRGLTEGSRAGSPTGYTAGMLILTLLACRPPPEAPDAIGELGRFLFLHFDDTDPTELEAGVTNLAAALREQDFEAPINDRTFSMPVLRPQDLGALSLPAGTRADDQIGVAGSGVSAFPLEDQLELILDPVQTCIESSVTTWAGRAFIGDPSCFFDGCDRVEAVDEVRRETGIARVWYDQPRAWRALSTASSPDAIDVVLGRAHLERVFEGDGGANAYRQLFVLDGFVADGDRTLRWYASWSDIDIVGLPDGFLTGLVVSGLEQALDYGDELLGDEELSCPHDRGAPRPERQ